MKSKTLHFLIGFALIAFSYSEAQTTHDLNWFTGIGSSVDLTIDIGDTVRWTWTDALPHTVEDNPAGSAVEMFTSGVLTGNGQTYEYTFTVEGSNDYFCGVHGAVSMSGTITVENNLSLDDETLNSFKIIQGTNDLLNIKLTNNLTSGTLTIHDMLGKQAMIQTIKNQSSLQLDVATLSQGLYLITIEGDRLKQTKRFVKL